MQCSRCGRSLKPLFITMVCDFCDGLSQEEGWDSGWVVWRGLPMPAEELVFATREDAERWQAAQGLENLQILPVCAPVAFRWSHAYTVSGEEIRMTDRPVTIYPDRRFPSVVGRACLAHA